MKPKNMSPDDIRIALIRSKATQAGIAKELGTTKTAVYLIIEGRSTSDRIRRKIAERCGIDIARIWPDPYLSGGARKAGRRKAI